MYKFFKKRLSIVFFIFIPVIFLWHPNWLGFLGIQPYWPLFWLLPWSMLNGSINGLIFGFFLGLILDSIKGIHRRGAVEDPNGAGEGIHRGARRPPRYPRTGMRVRGFPPPLAPPQGGAHQGAVRDAQAGAGSHTVPLGTDR